MDKQDKMAVLIDAENVSKKYIKLIMDEVSDYGIATYKRIYGDFTNPSVMAWQDALRDFALTPVFQFNYTKGKNASDSALIIDAMDILYSGKVNGFCLVTSDSDFTKLAIRLREAGMTVIGMGEQKTPNSLVSACETFKFLDLLYQESLEEQAEGEKASGGKSTRIAESPAAYRPSEERDTKKAPETKTKAHQTDPGESQEEKADNTKEDARLNNVPTKEEIGAEIVAIIESRSDENGWINQSEIGTVLPKRVPGFDPRNYKCKKLGQFIESFNYLETRTMKNPNNKLLKVVYVKIKQT